MALKDFLKKASDAANNLAAKGAQMAQQAKENLENERQTRAEAEAARKAEEAARKAEEAAKLAAEEAAKKQARMEMRDRILNGDPDDEYDEFYRIATEEEIEEFEAMDEAMEGSKNKSYLDMLVETTNCDVGKGDCCWNGDYFYCTCGDDVDCPRKKYVKARQFGKIHTLEHFPYIKYLSTIKQRDLFNDGRISYYCEGDGSYDHLLKSFFEKFLPQYAYDVWKDTIFEYGLGEENPILSILYYLQDETGGEVLASLDTLLYYLENGEIDLTQPFLKNVSIYNRGYKETSYTIKILDIVHNPDKLANYFTDPQKIDIRQLYNADGSVKEAGLGGPKNGHYGDVMYNIIATWEMAEEEEE